MKKRIAFIAFYAIVLAVAVVNVVFYVKDQFFFSLTDLPKGEFIYASLSPQGDQSANFYRVDTPMGPAARVELISFESDTGTPTVKNIYWETGKSSVTVRWEDNNIITVDEQAYDLSNGDTFDCRRKNSFSQQW